MWLPLCLFKRVCLTNSAVDTNCCSGLQEELRNKESMFQTRTATLHCPGAKLPGSGQATRKRWRQAGESFTVHVL
jgi:hypothetical protein